MEQRKSWQDLIEAYKMIAGLNQVVKEKVFPLAIGTRTGDTDLRF